MKPSVVARFGGTNWRRNRRPNEAHQLQRDLAMDLRLQREEHSLNELSRRVDTCSPVPPLPKKSPVNPYAPRQRTPRKFVIRANSTRTYTPLRQKLLTQRAEETLRKQQAQMRSRIVDENTPEGSLNVSPLSDIDNDSCDYAHVLDPKQMRPASSSPLQTRISPHSNSNGHSNISSGNNGTTAHNISGYSNVPLNDNEDFTFGFPDHTHEALPVDESDGDSSNDDEYDECDEQETRELAARLRPVASQLLQFREEVAIKWIVTHCVVDRLQAHAVLQKLRTGAPDKWSQWRTRVASLVRAMTGGETDEVVPRLVAVLALLVALLLLLFLHVFVALRRPLLAHTVTWEMLLLMTLVHVVAMMVTRTALGTLPTRGYYFADNAVSKTGTAHDIEITTFRIAEWQVRVLHFAFMVCHCLGDLVSYSMASTTLRFAVDTSSAAGASADATVATAFVEVHTGVTDTGMMALHAAFCAASVLVFARVMPRRDAFLRILFALLSQLTPLPSWALLSFHVLWHARLIFSVKSRPQSRSHDDDECR
ncbi:MAG: hypothetical protein MHM6MM_003233 [Cercozoa sp. M6MM]